MKNERCSLFATYPPVKVMQIHLSLSMARLFCSDIIALSFYFSVICKTITKDWRQHPGLVSEDLSLIDFVATCHIQFVPSSVTGGWVGTCKIKCARVKWIDLSRSALPKA